MVKILNEHQIDQKVKRLAIEIAEQNWQEQELILAGINTAGYRFAGQLRAGIDAYAPEIRTQLVHLRLNPADPVQKDPECDCTPDTLKGRSVLVVDDVANTGRTLFFAIQPILKAMPAKIQVAVLVDRTHKAFPIHVDHVGLRLATTLHEHIDVQLPPEGERSVFLR